jgi:hypothetical protein
MFLHQFSIIALQEQPVLSGRTINPLVSLALALWELFVPQRYDRVYARSAPRRQVARHERHNEH